MAQGHVSAILGTAGKLCSVIDKKSGNPHSEPKAGDRSRCRPRRRQATASFLAVRISQSGDGATKGLGAEDQVYTDTGQARRRSPSSRSRTPSRCFGGYERGAGTTSRKGEGGQGAWLGRTRRNAANVESSNTSCRTRSSRSRPRRVRCGPAKSADDRSRRSSTRALTPPRGSRLVCHAQRCDHNSIRALVRGGRQ